ncbi:MAG: hypothetical protein R3F61_26900 [Myxococcota bacterium]
MFEGWIAGLDERGFDTPLLALLRSHGFYDIHFTHGQYEFGKDFVAKRVEQDRVVQYAFQSKSGDIGGGEWDKIFAQLFEAAGGRLAHPNFDAAADRRCVLVTTGRLKGKAAQSANDFKIRVAGEADFSTWDCDYLLDLARGTNPEFPLRDLHPAIEQIVAEMQLGTLGSRTLLLGLERAVPGIPMDAGALHRASMEATLVIAALRRGGLDLHVPFVAAHLARLAAACSDAAAASVAYEEAMDIYQAAVAVLVVRFEAALSVRHDFLDVVGGSFEQWFTYPAACCLLGEYLAVGYLLASRRGDDATQARLLNALLALVRQQPGVFHPVSDRFAVSTMAMGAALAYADALGDVRTLLEATTVWLCDHLDDDGAGLAGPYADPTQEVEHLLGARLECIEVEARSGSLLAVALIEAANAWLPELYEDVLNDILAVKACPSAVIPIKLPHALFLNGGGTKALLNPMYPDGPAPLPWHDHEGWDVPESIASAAEAPLVFASACRDRLYQAAVFRAVCAAKGAASVE